MHPTASRRPVLIHRNRRTHGSSHLRRNRHLLAVPTLVAVLGFTGMTLAPAASAVPAVPAVVSTRVLAVAATYAGVPYRWGGTSTRGFDCSGYVQFVFHKLSVRLPRTAEEQWAHVEHIRRTQLRAGDLVFWGRPYGVYHVGIYAGGNKIWNAPHAGSRVRLETIWGGAKLYGRVRGLHAPVSGALGVPFAQPVPGPAALAPTASATPDTPLTAPAGNAAAAPPPVTSAVLSAAGNDLQGLQQALDRRVQRIPVGQLK